MRSWIRTVSALEQPVPPSALPRRRGYRLGAWMRDHGIEAFEYPSARSREALVQVGVLTPAVFQSTPFDHVEITAELSADHVSFLGHDDGQLHPFPRDLFLIDGQLPRAAQ